MIKVLIGNIFESNKAVLVNTVNCVGVMGKGIAKTFKDNYPEMYADYRLQCESGQVKPGKPYYYLSYDFFSETGIINFPTKDHWRSASKLIDIIHGLEYFEQHYQEWGVNSIAFPPLGCGNGGLEWSVVGKLMYQKLRNLEIDIEIYAPYGTSAQQLTEEFLSTPLPESLEKLYGRITGKIKPGWIAILEAVNKIQHASFTTKVGRVYFQKISYVITELGIETGFKFEKRHYGPYSKELKEALQILSNANIISEKQVGSKTVLVITDEYQGLRKRNQDIIEKYKHKIDKTVDLFSRIKDTDQAEEATTVFFSARKLKLNKANISEAELLEYILDWKKCWNNEAKKKSIISTIRNLVILKWLDVEYSKSLPENEYL